ncbi:MAG: hypothetical protein ACYDAK_08685 [Candidatus Limnocylindrales bacterium]
MRFQDASPDARAVVYAGIQSDPLVARLAELMAHASPAQLVLARAVMNGESSDPSFWREMLPTCFPDERSEALLAASLEVAARGEQIRNQFRGAVVEAVTELLLARRVAAHGGPRTAVRRERRILFDGVRAEIHPYDVTVELPGRAEAFDCKWSARGIDGDVLHQLDDARSHAAAEDERLAVFLVVFDTRLACRVRLAGRTEPHAGTRIVTIETLARLSGAPA